MSKTNAVNDSKKLKKLDAIRGFASVYVVFYHLFSKGLFIAGRDFSLMFKFGQEAVILFFLLSGFVIRYSYTLTRDKSFKTFFLKRFLRIFVPLICVFIANYSLFAFRAHAFIPVDWKVLAGNLLMLQDTPLMKPNVIVGSFLGNFPLWSLSYEWWFYMIFFVAINYIPNRTSITVYLIGVIAAITYVIYPNFINRELMYLVIWWIGADMAAIYLNKGRFTIEALKLSLITLVIIVLILVANVKIHKHGVSLGFSPFLELRDFSFAFITVLLALLWKKFHWVGFDKTFGWFEIITPISFGIYISHWFLLANAHYLDAVIPNSILRYSCYACICIFFSYLIERIIYIRVNRWVFPRPAAKTLTNND